MRCNKGGRRTALRSFAVATSATLIAVTAWAGAASGSVREPVAKALTTARPNLTADATFNSHGVYKFGFLGAVAVPFYDPVPSALKAAYKAFHLTTLPPFAVPPDGEQVEENTIVDGWVAKGFTGISIQVDDPVAGNATIARITSRGIPVVATGGCPNRPTTVPFCIATDNPELGHDAAVEMSKALGGKGNVALLVGETTDLNTAIYINAVKAGLKSFPGIHLVQTLTGMDELQPGESGIASLLAARGSTLQGIICLSGESTSLLGSALEKGHFKNIKAIGLNTFPNPVPQLVKSGWLYGVFAQNSYSQAYIAMDSLKMLDQGCKYKGAFNVDSGTFFVTAANIANAPQDLASATATIANTWSANWTCPST